MSNGLPNPGFAVVDPRKIAEYALNEDHPRGRSKARVFKSALGITVLQSSVLIDAIRKAVTVEPAQPGERDAFGARYLLDFHMVHGGRSATVRTCWIVRTGEDFPRLTSCYVL